MNRTVHRITVYFLILTIFNCFINAGLFASGDLPLKEGVFKESIKSVSVTREGWKLSYPIIELKGEVKIALDFDDISDDVKNYSYKIIHCDFNWVPTQINESEYIEGFRQNQFNNYSFSFNTSVKYVHYSLDLPNQDVNFLISGNYTIEAFEDYDESHVIFRKRFIIAESISDIIPFIQRPVLSVYRETSQEVNFNIEYGSFAVENPFSDLKVAVLQNGRWDYAINDLKPLFDKGGILEYTYQKENVFQGGNEYRWFDIKSMRYQSPYVKGVNFKEGYFHVELFPEEIRATKQYFYNQDLNGKYYIEIQEEKNSDLDADYVYVHFTLPCDNPYTAGEFYVMGDLAGNVYSANNKMKYNPDTKAYEITMLLKQGYYNYRYEFLKNGFTSGDPSYTEGNHYETENDYIFLLYHHGNRSRYDRIIGYQIANSLKKR
jgi:hypothetical protein